MPQDISTYTAQYFDTSPEQAERLAGHFVTRAYQRGDALVSIGQQRVGLYFVQSGYVRMYHTHPDTGKEITQWIAAPGGFATDAGALFMGLPSRWRIEMLTDGQLSVLNYEAYRTLAEQLPEWPLLERAFIKKCFYAIEQRVYAHLSLSAEGRYHTLLEQQPDLFNHVPLQYIASMLGMSPETLSRVRARASRTS